MRSQNSSLICILGWLKSDLRVVLLCFGFDWQIFDEKEETAHFWKIRRSTPRRRSPPRCRNPRLGEPEA